MSVALDMEENITDILKLGPDTRNVTLKMVKALPHFSLETLVMLRLYGPREFSIYESDDTAVGILMNPGASEQDLLRALRLAHHIYILDARHESRQTVIRAASVFERFHRNIQPEIAAQAYVEAMDALQFPPSLAMQGPTEFERAVMSIAGNPRQSNTVKIADHSVDKLSASLEAMAVKEWEGRLVSLHDLLQKGQLLVRDIREGQV
ncbi:hypothetical protein HWV62_20640 [Athelia sp. TMB]|nr:hypothetical protein HWV62_20640 [Athelia sp. TMB]